MGKPLFLATGPVLILLPEDSHTMVSSGKGLKNSCRSVS